MKKKIIISLFLLSLSLSGCSLFSFGGGESDGESGHVHTFSDEWSYDETNHWKEATCGHALRSEEARHTFEEHVIDATFDFPEIVTYECSVCGYSYEETRGNIKEHSFSDEWSYDEFGHYHACLDEGYEWLNEDYEAHAFSNFVIDAPKSDYENGRQHATCDICGYYYEEDIPSYVELSKEYLRFQLNEDEQSYSVESTYYGGNRILSIDKIVIPEIYNELPVTRIGDHAFSRLPLTYTVIIPSSIKEIDPLAFNSMDSLVYIVIPDTVESFDLSDESVMYDCNKLKEIIAPQRFYDDEIKNRFSENYHISLFSNEDESKIRFEDNFILYENEIIHYFGDESVITTPEIAKSIGEYAFYKQVNFVSLTLNEGMEVIKEHAFYDCNNLRTLTISSTLKKLPETLIAPSIINIVTNNNQRFVVKDHILYDSSYSTIYYVEKNIGGNIELPSSLSLITNDAFVNHGRLESVTFTNSSIRDFPSFKGCTNLKHVYGTKTMNIQSVDSFPPVFGGFEGCKNLKSFDIPQCISTLPKNAFFECRDLEEIDLGNVKFIATCAFAGCESLKNPTFPNSLTYIGEGAFSGCKSITEVQLPEAVRNGELCSNAFSSCSISSIDFSVFNDKQKALNAFACNPIQNFTFPIGITEVPDGCCKNNTYIESIVVPEGVTKIGSSAFAECTNLKSITLPSTLNEIEDYCFENCTSLTELIIPEGVTAIGNWAFNYSSIIKLIIPSTFTTIKNGNSIGFMPHLLMLVNNSSTELVGISLVDDTKSVLYVTEGNLTRSEDGFYVVESNGKKTLVYYDGESTDVVIPSDINDIAPGAFYANSYIESVVIPEGITELYEGTFYMCWNLRDVTLPNSLKVLGRAFSVCESLLTITIPTGVTEIAPYALDSCKVVINLSSVSESNIISDTKPEIYKTPEDNKKLHYDDNGFVTWTENGEVTLLRYFGHEEKVVIPEGVTRIGKDMFTENSIFIYGDTMPEYKEVVIPSTVKEIEYDIFFGYTYYDPFDIVSRLEKIEVSQDNPYFSSQDGILYNKDFTELIRCPRNIQLTSITIPSSVIKIAPLAFQKCNKLISVNIPDSCQEIGESAFRSCDELRNVNLPSSLKCIETFLFIGCNSLRELIIPEGVTAIKEGALQNLELYLLVIPTSCIEFEHNYSVGADVEEIRYNGTRMQFSLINKGKYCGIDDGDIVFCSDGIWY